MNRCYEWRKNGLTIDTYVLAKYPFFGEFVSLVPAHMCRIRNGTIPFIAQKTGSTEGQSNIRYRQ